MHSKPILPYPILPYPVLSYPILQPNPISSHATLPHPILSNPIPSHPLQADVDYRYAALFLVESSERFCIVTATANKQTKPTSSRIGVPPTAPPALPAPLPPGVSPPTVDGVPGTGVDPPAPPAPGPPPAAPMALGVVILFWRGAAPPKPVPSWREGLAPPRSGVWPDVRAARLRASCGRFVVELGAEGTGDGGGGRGGLGWCWLAQSVSHYSGRLPALANLLF